MDIRELEHNGVTYIGEFDSLDALSDTFLNTYEQCVWEDGNTLRKALKEGEDENVSI